MPFQFPGKLTALRTESRGVWCSFEARAVSEARNVPVGSGREDNISFVPYPKGPGLRFRH